MIVSKTLHDRRYVQFRSFFRHTKVIAGVKLFYMVITASSENVFRNLSVRHYRVSKCEDVKICLGEPFLIDGLVSL